jgi:hypothetical protein
MREGSIKRKFGVSRGGVRSTIAYEVARPDGATQDRAGTPKKYTDRDARMMLRYLRLHPKLTFAQRREQTGLECKNT